MSVLREGLSIPIAFQNLFYERIGFRLSHGESATIKISLDGMLYDVSLKNCGFNQGKYQGHSDILQIRYSPSGPFAMKLRSVFASTSNKVEQFRKSRIEKKKRLTIPSDEKEFLALYATPEQGIIVADCITRDEYREEIHEIQKIEEKRFEDIVDTSTAVSTRVGTYKVRKLSRAIGNSLKHYYGYRCQICGQQIGKPYGSNLIHAHHIDYFTKSLNNNPDNILIVCPNHHGIIHDCNPIFQRASRKFIYPNGYEEGLMLNNHIF